ncbi:MAG: DegT/DnrJ/EryC1/StrS family aminotransferase [Candidatus Omnitrophica bacterium]|nr:DegT/DnrJ/EryC1/StrS family aminotransferase [Candidatus Omnitrophota bacterium]
MKKIPWFSPKTGRREKELALRVIGSNYLNDGEYTRIFEKKIAGFIGVKHCVGVTSGTAAISLSLMGLGIGHGDEVIVPDLTFIATANAVRLTGATVRLADIEPRRFSLDVGSVIGSINKRTKAIVTVDVNGRAADYGLLKPLAKKKKLFLVCDATEGLGSKYNGRYLGTFGDAGCFSFSANKTVTTGQGGMVATDNTKLYHRLLELKDQGRRYQGTGGNDLHPVMGYNFKFTNLQSAVGIAQLERISGRLAHSKKRDDWYKLALAGCRNLVIPALENQKEEVTQWTDILVEDRSRLEKALLKSGIGFRPFWYPLHTQRPYKQAGRNFPNASRVSASGLWLPSSFDLTRKQAEYASKVVRSVLEKD